MGFWSSVASFVGSVASTVGSAISKVKDWITGSSESVGQSRSYNSETASVAETINISEILTSFLLKIRDQTDLIEEDIIEDIEVYFEDLEDEVKEVIDPTLLKDSLKQTKKEIKGFLKKYISKKVSIDNYECLAILEMKSGSDKTNKMAQFQKKVINDGIDELEKKLSRAISRNEKILLNSIKSTLTAQTKQIELSIQSTEKELQDKLSQNESNYTNNVAPLTLLYQLEMIDYNLT